MAESSVSEDGEGVAVCTDFGVRGGTGGGVDEC